MRRTAMATACAFAALLTGCGEPKYSVSGKVGFMALLRSADVLVHNFRPGVVEKLGLDCESLRNVDPRLVYACSSGWGDEGPYVERQRKGHADMAAATAGLFRHKNSDGTPLPPGITTDYPAGLLLALGILLALFERERSGKGQRVSTDLLSAAVSEAALSGVHLRFGRAVVFSVSS